jgi:hypothetical protein
MKDSPAMRLSARALETRSAVVDPPTRPQRESGDGLEKSHRRTARAVSGYAVAMTRLGPDSPQAIRAIVWTRKCPVRTPGKIDKPLWALTFGGPAETKKARSVVASSRVPRWAGFAGSPPAAGLLRTVNWPLVQIPADRHTTTGTCVLGKITIWANRASVQEFSCAGTNNFVREATVGGELRDHSASEPLKQLRKPGDHGRFATVSAYSSERASLRGSG